MRLRWIVMMAALALVLVGVLVGPVGARQTALPAGNLVKNPGGEVPFGGDHWTRNIAPAAWQKEDVPAPDGRVGEGVQVVRYGKNEGNGILGTARSASIAGGKNYFSGGYPASISTAYQMIDVSGAAADIDAGGVKACLSAYLGGSLNSPAAARVDLQFLGEDESALGQLRIGPVTRGQRQDQYALLRRASETAVPTNTRRLRVSFTAENPGGVSNLGFGDNISVALVKGGGCDPVLAVKCVKKTLVASVTPSAVAPTQRVRFAVKGGKKTKQATAKSTSRFTMDGLTGKLTVTAVVSQKGGGSITVTKKSKRC
jgi:hypothetical protein